MKTYSATPLIERLAFPEGPRWHQKRFWFTDQHARRIYCIDAGGDLKVIAETGDLPGGLGWLPDGTLLVVYMTERQVMQWNGEQLVSYADLSRHASFHCNDMVVDKQGRVYVGNFGFDLHGGEARRDAELIMIGPEGNVSLFDDSVVFPNGCVIPPQGDRLIVAETFAHRLTEFRLQADGSAASSGLWADLGAATPDGICLDEEGKIWVASPGTNELFRVKRSGQRVATCSTRGVPYACMLGGEHRKTLYICTSETDDPREAASRKSGRIECADVDVAGAGLP
jgi:sugar lactone lactonase YvrE